MKKTNAPTRAPEILKISVLTNTFDNKPITKTLPHVKNVILSVNYKAEQIKYYVKNNL